MYIIINHETPMHASRANLLWEWVSQWVGGCPFLALYN